MLMETLHLNILIGSCLLILFELVSACFNICEHSTRDEHCKPIGVSLFLYLWTVHKR